MRVDRRTGWRCVAAIAFALACGVASAGSDTVSAQARTAALRLTAYAEVEPIALVRINAPHSGVVTALQVLPGDRVKAGALLGRLAGPEIEARRRQARAALTNAEAALAAARERLAATRQERTERLANRQAVARAEAGAARARAAVVGARARLSALEATLSLRAPVAGTVLALSAADGERVARHQTLVSLQPAGSLWLKADFYGRAAAEVERGMSGRFVPAAGGPGIAVRVRSIYATLRPDGARAVGLVATGGHPIWWNGEAGRVILEGPARTLAAVPTRALILDRGRWWVLVRGPRGDERRAVIPGPSRGEWTLIERGIRPGTQVVSRNAYLDFHRGVARQYQPPD